MAIQDITRHNTDSQGQADSLSDPATTEPVDMQAHAQAALKAALKSDFGLAFGTLAGDFSEVNFSSARMGANEFSRT